MAFRNLSRSACVENIPPHGYARLQRYRLFQFQSDASEPPYWKLPAERLTWLTLSDLLQFTPRDESVILRGSNISRSMNSARGVPVTRCTTAISMAIPQPS